MENETLFAEVYGLRRAALEFSESRDEGRRMAARETINLFAKFKDNVLLQEVLAGPESTLFERAEEIRRRKYGGLRKYLPHNKDANHDFDVKLLSELVPNVQHLITPMMGVCFPDNPITGLAYGILGSVALQDAGMLSFSNPLEAITLGSEAGLVLGLGTNLWLRNRNHSKNREDFVNARVWDTTQYLDMMVHFMRQGEETLGRLKDKAYPTPIYHSLTDKQRDLAYANLAKNPFVRGMNVCLGFTSDNYRVPRRQALAT